MRGKGDSRIVRNDQTATLGRKDEETHMQCGRRNGTFSLEDGSGAAYGLKDGASAYKER